MICLVLPSREVLLSLLALSSSGLLALSQPDGKSSRLALPANNVSSINVSAEDIDVECDGRKYGRPVRIAGSLAVPFISYYLSLCKTCHEGTSFKRLSHF